MYHFIPVTLSNLLFQAPKVEAKEYFNRLTYLYHREHLKSMMKKNFIIHLPYLLLITLLLKIGYSKSMTKIMAEELPASRLTLLKKSDNLENKQNKKLIATTLNLSPKSSQKNYPKNSKSPPKLCTPPIKLISMTSSKKEESLKLNLPANPIKLCHLLSFLKSTLLVRLRYG